MIRMGCNEYLITSDKLEIEIFFKGQSQGTVHVQDVINGGVYNILIDAYFEELYEVVQAGQKQHGDV
ncbi:MAG: hypothetical protein GY749_48170 [Desulfobacteraceae bacterium]|nr:hypothetical protein [Desulfobacteraceae bacterium]